jgi:predicted lipoprotein with Yx(FWY)xxD motif
MKKVINIRPLLSFVVLLWCTVFHSLTAQWSTYPAFNNVISTTTGHQFSPTLVSDGLGGAIITWYDNRNSATTGYDIYAQRINASGAVQWSADGVPISSAALDQINPTIISDGSGGAIITWMDYRSGNYDIYARKINSSGVVQWTTNGVAISTAINDQNTPTIVSDGSGGAIITWVDYHGGVYSDIYAQRINASGVVLWSVDGVPISTAAYDQADPTIVSDGSGGAIVTWTDARSGIRADIYAQRINGSGVVQWLSDGVAISIATNNKSYQKIVGDGTGGAIITWQDFRSGNYDIYAQRINMSGVVQWAADGVPISIDASSQHVPTIVNDGLGGAIIAWHDFRSGTDNDIYAQKIHASGVVQWSTNGVAISTAVYEQNMPTIVSDGSGGAIITWQDTRSGVNQDIYGQKINASGVVQWIANGVAISTAVNAQSIPRIISDGLGGAIIAWNDFRNEKDYDIYAQKIDKYGFLGQVASRLIAAKDVANDQGGRMRIFWDPSYLDADVNQTVKSYTVKLGAKTTGILGKSSEALGTGIYWQTADIIRADQSEGYSVVAKTYADSGLQGVPMYYFQVIAKNSDSTQSWYSNIDSGYSVDNIPPVGVGNAMISVNGGGILLKWAKNRVDKDLMEYRIYRSTTAGFTISSGTQLSTTTDTTYNDPSGTNGTSYYYRIAAMDVHGNLGSPSNELNETALSLELTSFVVSANRRNANIAWSVATETNNFGYEIERRSMDAVGDIFQRVGFVEGNGTSQTARQYSYSDKNVGSGIFSYRLKQIDRNGQYTFTHSVEVTMGVAPKEFALEQNYPNPFNPTTTIEFTVPSNGLATLKVFNTLGEEVATLFSGEAEAGRYNQVQFNAIRFASGIYYAKLSSAGKSQIKKLLLIK